MRVLIIGAGGHAQVVADTLLCMQDEGADVELLGYLDDNSQLTGEILLQRPVLGKISAFPRYGHDALLMAIGDNKMRRQLYLELRNQGEEFVVARHPKSTVAESVEVGPGTVVCAGVVINPGAFIGANVILNTSCTIEHHSQIGNHCHIGPGARLGGGVKVGESSLIGIGATVLPRTRIGKACIVGAGAVVLEDVPDFSTVVGNPAREIRETPSSPEVAP